MGKGSHEVYNMSWFNGLTWKSSDPKNKRHSNPLLSKDGTPNDSENEELEAGNKIHDINLEKQLWSCYSLSNRLVS